MKPVYYHSIPFHLYIRFFSPCVTIFIFIHLFSTKDLNFVQSGEWQVNGIAVTQLMQSFPCCRDEFSAVAYTVTLSRFPQFYFLYIFFPIVSQFFLFLMVFIHSNIKSVYCITFLNDYRYRLALYPLFALYPRFVCESVTLYSFFPWVPNTHKRCLFQSFLE